MFKWLRKLLASRAGYVAGYRKGRSSGLVEAGLEALLIKQQAEAAGNARCQAIVRAAEEEKAEIIAVVSKQASAIGYQDGLAQGQRAGADAAYVELARSLGLVTTTRPKPSCLEGIHYGPHANIYREEDDDGGTWVVRITIDGELSRANFGWDKIDQRDYALCNAVRYRNRYSRSVDSLDLLGEVLREIPVSPADRLPRSADPDWYARHLMQICNKYRDRSRAVEDVTLFHQQPIWVGDAPEARFNLADPTIVARPWESLWDGRPPKVWQEAMGELGLEKRNVRDLLLFEAHEFDQCAGIGPATLRQLRNRLAARRLYLWGEGPFPLPAAPTAAREGRAIDLENWAQTDLDERRAAT